MENPTYIALSRLVAQERTMSVVASNVANADTPGFKSEHVLFSDWILKSGAVGEGREGNIDFTQDRATWRDRAAGSLTHTGNPLDLAIGHDGFFSVKTPNGIKLTRAGQFTLQADGTIADTQGNPLLDDQGGTLSVDPGDTDLTVAGDGTLSGSHGVIGKVGIVLPADVNRIVAEGNHVFRSDSPTTPVSAPAIVQGAVEGSNVSPMLELTNMMQLSREFQFTTQFIESEAQRQQNAIDKLANIGSA